MRFINGSDSRCTGSKWLTFCDILIVINQLSNSSCPVNGQQNDDRPMPVHELSGFRVIILHQLVSISVPVGACAMSAWMHLKSEDVFGSKTITDPKNIAWCPPDDFFKLNDPKNYRRMPLAIKLYLKLNGASTMSKIFNCCHLTDAG